MDLLLGLATSLHLGLDGNYNNLHPHIGLEYNNILGGAYYNSESNISTYMGYELEFEHFNLEGGIVTGYDETLTPYLRVTRELDENRKAFIAPATDIDAQGKTNIGVVLGLEFYINK